MKQSNTFETTYTRYPFAPLVALGVSIAAGIKSIGGKANKPTAKDNGALIAPRQHAAA